MEAMRADLVGIHRPQRWDVPFGADMTEADVERIVTFPPFSGMDPARFPPALPLRGILLHDARLRRCRRGDIIVRAGDYLNSAFFIVSGTCRLELEPVETRLSDAVLGRRKQHRKGLFQLVAQLWNHRWTEVRDPKSYVLDPRIARRGQDQETRIYLQDVQTVLNSRRTAQLGPGSSFG